MSSPFSSKNVKFITDLNSMSETQNSQKKISLSNVPRKRSSKITTSSFDQISTRYSKKRQSHPSNFLLNEQLARDINSNRIDVYGNEIVKGSKRHKVSFIDMISPKKIAEVVLIESSYSNNGNFKNNTDKIICECNSCFIF